MKTRRNTGSCFKNAGRMIAKAKCCSLPAKTGHPVQLSLATLQLEERISLSIILTDLIAQKKTQQQLLENNTKLEDINHALEVSNHDLQQFASVASHDLQEPLRKIIMFSDLIKDRFDGLTTDTAKYLQKVINSFRRMKTLIIDILTYSKLSANNFHFEYIG